MNVASSTRTSPAPKPRIKVLCVDDEPALLEGVALHLRRSYEVLSATSGSDALALVKFAPELAVIVSDMRMPNMSGATFLARARELVPDATRILLTGQTDLDSAIAAVNEGQIFRFLTKPCAPPALVAAIDAAAQQHRLVTAERVLLEQTLRGSIKALTDVLALTHPTTFGRASRLKQLAAELAEKVGLTERWHLEVAAMLSQLGAIALPSETAEKLHYGQALSEPERKMLERVPAVTEQLLGNIPRLEAVREILAFLAGRAKPLREGERERAVYHLAAEILRVASDFDALETHGLTAEVAFDTLRGRAGQYEERVLEALAAICGKSKTGKEVRELPVALLREGMVLAEDIRMLSGTLIATRGYEVNAGFVERARNFRPGTIKEPVRVLLRGPGTRVP